MMNGVLHKIAIKIKSQLSQVNKPVH